MPSSFCRRLLAGAAAAALAAGAYCATSLAATAATLSPAITMSVVHTPASAQATPPGVSGLPAKQECVYSAHRISILDQFDQMIGRRLDCAQVYANAAQTWAEWEKPWFIDYYTDADLDWSAWATAAQTSRRLVITLSLFPSDLDHADWLAQGAAGRYTRYDTVLAKNLVAAGLGHSIIRLAPEMNGNWYPYSLGTTRAQWARWDRFWIRTVEAMRSVPGAHFAFDWTVNVGYRPLPLSEIYPGNRFVDIIGMDVYDVGKLGAAPTARWKTSYGEPDGIGTVLAFAHAENKPLSIPEWGIAPKAYLGGGDDPTFVNGIASVVRDNPVVYESYFYREDYATQLKSSPASLAAYRRHFGAHGDSVDSGTDLWPAATGRK